ncbi:MAG: tRNA uridine-5-carboxymethylaminomethyl(34) synthesis enzyme MnmG, partial [Lentisphaeria bacterium]|nr:tRNA uridine-5-carboxymethylaminomethyl(34) synthesis enzyme MnmG [Lentisphaeria bacterium]
PLADLGYNGEDPQERRVMRQLVIRSHYEGYLRQEAIAVGHLRALESWQIPGELDYSTIPGLRNESRMKLKKVMPGTLAQASRIDGVTPAEIALLQVHIARLRKTPKDEA